jgi:hypothetical protein
VISYVKVAPNQTVRMEMEGVHSPSKFRIFGSKIGQTDGAVYAWDCGGGLHRWLKLG